MSKEKPPRKEPPLEDILNKDGRMMRSPALWFAFLIIPVVICLYVGLRQESTATEGTARPDPVVYTPPGATHKLTPTEQQDLLHRGGGDCGYQDWVGKKADEAMQAQLKSDKRAFRILPPGAMMTMDFSASRHNFDVDADGTITRVWCG